MFTKFLAKAAVIGGLAVAGLAMATPADAGVHVGIGVAGPAYYHGGHRAWCYHHPHKCGYARGYYGGPRVAVGIGGPRIGVFYTGRGWWDGHRYWGHRERWHGRWRYR